MNTMKTAAQIVEAAIDAAGQAGGIDEVRAIAASGAGAMDFSPEDMAALVEAYGSAGDALYAVQLEAQRRVDSPTVAAIGSDGLRLVVWGLGADAQSAIEDAARWVEESHPAPELTCVEVNLDQVARIAAGDIDCSALGIVP